MGLFKWLHENYASLNSSKCVATHKTTDSLVKCGDGVSSCDSEPTEGKELMKMSAPHLGATAAGRRHAGPGAEGGCPGSAHETGGKTKASKNGFFN